MPSLFQRSVRLLESKFKASAGEWITYYRGQDSVRIEAAPVANEVETTTEEEFQLSSRNFDWLIAEQDLFLSGEKVEPQRGDYITYRQQDDRIARYVIVPGLSERCFDVVDRYGIIYRVHSIFDGYVLDE